MKRNNRSLILVSPAEVELGSGGRCHRNLAGFSVLEALVSLVIAGIAIAGITELLWANTAWMASIHNKFDTFYAAKRLLSRLEHDSKQSIRIKKGSNSTTLILERASEQDFDGNGFLTSAADYFYWVESDFDPGYEGQYIMKAGNAYPSAGVVVLKGIAGPKGLSDGLPKVFQYVDKNSGVLDSASNDTRSLIVNFELKRIDFGKSRNDGPLKTGLAIRHEYFLRNASIHGY